jgi:hypothetical protein
MRWVPGLVIVGLAAAAPHPAPAQGRPVAPSASPLYSAAPAGPLQPRLLDQAPDSAPRRIRPTQWKKGAAIGAGVGGAIGLLLGPALCSLAERSGPSCIAGSVVAWTLVGAIPGAFVGGQFRER